MSSDESSLVFGKPAPPAPPVKPDIIKPAPIDKPTPVKPDIQPTELPIAAQDVDDDYGLLSYLTFYTITVPAKDWAEKLQNAQDNVTDWQALDAKRVEDAISGKIKTKELATDRSLLSALKRNDFRGKVAQYCKDHAGWLPVTSCANGNKTLTAAGPAATTTIMQYILTLIPPTSCELKLVISPAIRSITLEKAKSRSFDWTFIHHTYDKVLGKIATTVTQLHLRIDIAVTPGKDTVQALVEHQSSAYSFIHQQWEEFSKTAAAAALIKAGKEISPKFTLHLGPSS